MAKLSWGSLFGHKEEPSHTAPEVPSAAPVLAAVSERRFVASATAEPTQRQVWQQTMRAMVQATLISQGDATAMFQRADREELVQREPLETCYTHFMGRSIEDAEHAAAVISVAGQRVPICEFRTPDVPRAFYERYPDVFDGLRRFRACVLWAQVGESHLAFTIASFNPVVVSVLAEHMRSLTLSSGLHPYIGVMRLSAATWKNLENKHFPQLS